ncbi:fasciclin-3 isoform X2 [Anopheles arabiensis]|uniref:fasciclin-3 isoform X2 n=1 Tax=Anopheles arabiensis TaxID=7173 RepID=UPI001AAD50ED|nr:fasciclin-3 isoform X2 [Anopheles arabiensis]
MQPKMQAVHFLPRCVLLLSVCAAFTATTTHAQVVDTEPRSITVVENQENVELHCRIGRPAQLCLIRMPGLNDQIALSPTEKSPVAGYHYHGEGLDKGSCGVRIDRVTADNAGLMNCTLFVDGRGLTGSIEIVVAFPPQQPVIEVVQGNLANVEVNSQLMFRCTAERGNPAANLSWFLDQEQIYEGVQFPEAPEEYYDERSNKHMFTATSTLKRAVRAEDNGKRLTCQAQHLAYPEGVSRTDLILDVNFQPQALPDQVVYGLQLGRTATASMVIKANPSPHVMWNIDGTDYHQGTEQGRYAVPIPEALGNNRYNVSLTIAGLTLEDLSKTYVLRASNNFGVEEYRLTLRSQDEVFSESSSFGTGEIVGLVLAVVIVLLAVALIVGARATGRWCFRGKNSSTSTSAAKIGETDTTDNGVGETMLPTATGIVVEANVLNGETTTTTTIPVMPPTPDNINSSILRPTNVRQNPLDAAYPLGAIRREPQHSINSGNFDNASVLSSDSSSTIGYGDPNQVGLPVATAQKRWIPHQQRELLEKQAQLLLSGAALKRKRETEIF